MGTFPDGIGKPAFLPVFRAHVLEVRSTRKHNGFTLRDEASNKPPTGIQQPYCAFLDEPFEETQDMLF